MIKTTVWAALGFGVIVGSAFAGLMVAVWRKHAHEDVCPELLHRKDANCNERCQLPIDHGGPCRFEWSCGDTWEDRTRGREPKKGPLCL